MAVHKEVYQFTFSGWMNITEDIENGWHVKMTMQKCYDIRNLDTCDFHKSVSLVKDGCVSPDEVYSMFFQYVSPKMKCPIRAGFYNITEFPFFTEDTGLMGAESKISTSVFGYTYRLEAFDDDDDPLFCVEAYLRMMYLRHHDWIGDQKIHNYDVEITTTGTPGEETEGPNLEDLHSKEMEDTRPPKQEWEATKDEIDDSYQD